MTRAASAAGDAKGATRPPRVDPARAAAFDVLKTVRVEKGRTARIDVGLGSGSK